MFWFLLLKMRMLPLCLVLARKTINERWNGQREGRLRRRVWFYKFSRSHACYWLESILLPSYDVVKPSLIHKSPSPAPLNRRRGVWKVYLQFLDLIWEACICCRQRGGKVELPLRISEGKKICGGTSDLPLPPSSIFPIPEYCFLFVFLLRL